MHMSKGLKILLGFFIGFSAIEVVFSFILPFAVPDAPLLVFLFTAAVFAFCLFISIWAWKIKIEKANDVSSKKPFVKKCLYGLLFLYILIPAVMLSLLGIIFIAKLIMTSSQASGIIITEGLPIPVPNNIVNIISTIGFSALIIFILFYLFRISFQIVSNDFWVSRTPCPAKKFKKNEKLNNYF